MSPVCLHSVWQHLKTVVVAHYPCLRRLKKLLMTIMKDGMILLTVKYGNKFCGGRKKDFFLFLFCKIWQVLSKLTFYVNNRSLFPHSDNNGYDNIIVIYNFSLANDNFYPFRKLFELSDKKKSTIQKEVTKRFNYRSTVDMSSKQVLPRLPLGSQDTEE